MLGHSVLQAAHGLDVRLVHELPHLQHLAGSEDSMEITHEPDLPIAQDILLCLRLCVFKPESSQELHDTVVVSHVPTALSDVHQVGEHLPLLFHGPCSQDQPRHP